jgi:lantibiotic leader peptide-processing serine protease
MARRPSVPSHQEAVMLRSASSPGVRRARRAPRRLLPLVPLLAAAACADPPAAPAALSGRVAPRASVAAAARSYLVVASGELPPSLVAQLRAAGGTVERVVPEIGVAAITSADPGFLVRAGRLGGVRGVVADDPVPWVTPQPYAARGARRTLRLPVRASSQSAAATVGANETYRHLQWPLDAISAPAAWRAGALGAGARVAIVDGGIDRWHVDLAGNIDVARSRSFVPGTAFDEDVDLLWHGTAMAGIVAAAANGVGTVGVAPKATIIGVKVLDGHVGRLTDVLAGIVYAAKPIADGGAGAHVVNLSLSTQLVRSGSVAAHWAVAISRATGYAAKQGALVVASAGNSYVDLDHTANLLVVPAQSTGVVAVSAVTPVGWAVPGAAQDFDRPTTYSNHGSSAIGVAAPGGDTAFPGEGECDRPLAPSGVLTLPCWLFDLVIAPASGEGRGHDSYEFTLGTSAAAAMMSGVAALVVGKHGRLTPANLRALLEKTADDLGKPGNDPFYGAGRINALRAVTR